MIQLTALYGHPQDTAAFDHYYREKHGPLASKIPGLKGFTASKSVGVDPNEQSPYYVIANLYFENMQTFMEALQSPEGQATAGDIQNFATGGCTLVVGEVDVYAPISIS
ncbi:MAG TPA: EthD family reductase [Ktedonobacteraceae bacterium]|nr:EthD family reductase [Ktedonobacteraceae bacterium]